MCGWQKNFIFSCGGGVLIFLKRRYVGRLVSPISSKVVSFVCCCPPVKVFGRVSQFNFLVVSFMVAVSSNTLSANVLRLGDVADF